MDHLTAPDLANTPYKYHVYLASEKGSIRNDLIAKLDKGCRLSVYELSSGNEKEDIENGILLSRCVVFLWTKGYGSDHIWPRYEISTARTKQESLREDLVIVLKASDEPIKDINFGRQLNYYHEKDDDFVQLCSILCGSSPQPTLHVMPNIGAASALSFYSGYLKVILPDIFQRCLKQRFVCPDGCKADDHSQCECIMAAAYFLIIPYSLKGPAELSEWDKEMIEDETRKLKCTWRKEWGDNESSACTKDDEHCGWTRGGLRRDYSTTVHKLNLDHNHDPDLPKFYRFLAEVPNILINLNDLHDRVVGLSLFQRRLEAMQFHQHLERLIETDPACCGKVHYLFYDDKEINSQKKIVERIKELITEIIKQEGNKASFTEEVHEPYPVKNFQQLKEEKESCPRCIQLLDYDLQTLNHTADRKVGHGMVINLREDMQEDILKIHTTLACLSLDVYVEAGHMSVMTNMQSFLSNRLCPDSKIFLCVLLANGENGQLCDKDGSVFDFCDLVDLVSMALGNKPIVFIVEASERRGVTSEYEEVDVDLSQSPTQPHDSQQTQETRSSLSPEVCDFLGYFSGQPGLHSEGSYAHTFISSLCKHIEEKAGTLDLENIIKAVTEEMRIMSGSTVQELGIRDRDTADMEKPIIPTIPFVYSTLSKYVDFSQVFVSTKK